MGWSTQLPDKRWRWFESEGSDAGRIRANAIGKTRTEARNLALAKLTKKRRESSLEPHTLTLAAYLARWFKHMRAGHAVAHTVDSYESIARRHLPLVLAQTKLADLRPLPIQRVLDDRVAAGASPNSVRKQYKMLHAALAQAVAWRLLLTNPMTAVTPPPPSRPEMTALDEAQTAALLGLLDGFWHTASLVAVTTGLRRGELLGLGWAQVDMDGATITVRRVVEEAKGAPRLRDYPKTTKSRRVVTLMAATVATLQAHKRGQAASRLADAGWRDLGLVFPAGHGRLWRPSTFSREWGDLGAGLRFHDLRHTHATQLLRAGVPADAVAKRLGHSSPVITMTTYAHVLEDADTLAVERMEASLGERLSADHGAGMGT